MASKIRSWGQALKSRRAAQCSTLREFTCGWWAQASHTYKHTGLLFLFCLCAALSGTPLRLLSACPHEGNSLALVERQRKISNNLLEEKRVLSVLLRLFLASTATYESIELKRIAITFANVRGFSPWICLWLRSCYQVWEFFTDRKPCIN